MRLFLIWVILLCIPSFGSIEQKTRRSVRIGKGLESLAFDTDSALKKVINQTVAVLREKGFKDQAREIQTQFETQFDGYVARQYLGRNIGDYLPLSDYLAITYEITAVSLGCGIPNKIDICQLTHISDLKTLNYAIPIVFHPCGQAWGKADYKDHFSGDANYYGLFPVVVFWSCLGSTFGMGWSFLCSPAEWATEKLAAPALSDFIFDSLCG